MDSYIMKFIAGSVKCTWIYSKRTGS